MRTVRLDGPKACVETHISRELRTWLFEDGDHGKYADPEAHQKYVVASSRVIDCKQARTIARAIAKRAAVIKAECCQTRRSTRITKRAFEYI
jgi:hypothetical protein